MPEEEPLFARGAHPKPKPKPSPPPRPSPPGPSPPPAPRPRPPKHRRGLTYDGEYLFARGREGSKPRPNPKPNPRPNPKPNPRLIPKPLLPLPRLPKHRRGLTYDEYLFARGRDNRKGKGRRPYSSSHRL
jgi:hypothetical protein